MRLAVRHSAGLGMGVASLRSEMSATSVQLHEQSMTASLSCDLLGLIVKTGKALTHARWRGQARILCDGKADAPGQVPGRRCGGRKGAVSAHLRGLPGAGLFKCHI